MTTFSEFYAVGIRCAPYIRCASQKGLTMTLKLSVIFALALTLLPFAIAFTNPVYIISNAETPSLNLPGLTPIGKKRANQCLPALLAPLDIGLILACPLDSDSGLCAETVQTITPTANSLNLTVDTSCGAGEESDDDCVQNHLNKFAKNSTQSMLVVWDIADMDSLFENLNIDDDGDDDDDDDDDDDTPHFDVLATMVKKKVSTVSQSCSGIDGQAAGTFRRRSLKKRMRSIKKCHISSRIARH